jgi:hypothetical protein
MSTKSFNPYFTFFIGIYLLWDGIQTLCRWKILGYIDLPDADPWMRLVRIEQLYRTWNWYDIQIPSFNAPEGMPLTWTRPFDLLILACALCFKPFFTLKKALFWGGWCLNPIFLFISTHYFQKIMRFLDYSWLAIAIGIGTFLTHPTLQSTFTLGRIDHHSLFVMWFLITLHALLKKSQHLGVLLGFGLWLSPEYLSVAMVSVLWLGGLWIQDPEDYEKHLARTMITAMGVIVLACGLEHPPSAWDTVEYDRISIVYVALWGLMTGMFFLLTRLKLKTLKQRVLGTCVAITIILGTMLAGFPQFYLGPLAAVDPRIYASWFKNISEIRSAFAPERWGTGITIFLPLFCALPGLKQGQFRGLFLLTAMVFGALTLQSIRWSYYAVPVFLMLYAHSVGRIQTRKPIVLMMGALLLPACGIGCQSVWEAWHSDAQQRKDTQAMALCENALQHWIQEDRFTSVLGLSKARILLPLMDGPTLLFWTPHEAIGGNYTHNVTGIQDTLTFFNTTDPAIAHHIIQKRGIQAIAFCAITPEQQPAFLKHGRPSWLQQVNGTPQVFRAL